MLTLHCYFLRQQAGVVLWLTWDYISYAALCGVGLLFAMTPLHFVMSKHFG
jgi:hypothetical protein